MAARTAWDRCGWRGCKGGGWKWAGLAARAAADGVGAMECLDWG